MAKTISQLKEAAARATNARVRAKVELEHAEKQLKELGYDSVDEAKAALSDYETKIDRLEADIETEIAKIENDYPELADQ